MSDDDKLSFLDQPRDDKGRFATSGATEPAPAPAAAPAPAPETTAPPAPASEPPTTDTSSPAPAAPPASQPAIPPGYIPLAAQLDEREKRQAAERERDELKRRWEETQQRQQQQPLDPLDTEGFERALNERFGDFEWKTRTAISHSFAVRTHGAESVQAAEQWLEQTHAIPLTVLRRQADPYDFAVRAHKKALRDQELGDDTDIAAIFEKNAAKYGYVKAPGQQTQPSTASAPPVTTALPPPSLASAPAAGGKAPTVPTGPGTAHGALFK